MNTWSFEGLCDVVTPDGKTIKDGVRADLIALVVFPAGSVVTAPRRVIVSADSWYFARQHARAVLGTDEGIWEVTTEAPDYVVTWIGRDAGLKPDRRMVVEARAEAPYGLADNRKLQAAGLLTRRTR